jgi:hypothetical protein
MAHPSKGYGGKLADPQVRHDRASKARAAQTTTDYYVQKVVDRAPELTAEQRDRLAVLLRGPSSDAAA